MPLIASVLFSQQDLTTDSWHWLGAADALTGPLVQIKFLCVAMERMFCFIYIGDHGHLVLVPSGSQ